MLTSPVHSSPFYRLSVYRIHTVSSTAKALAWGPGLVSVFFFRSSNPPYKVASPLTFSRKPWRYVCTKPPAYLGCCCRIIMKALAIRLNPSLHAPPAGRCVAVPWSYHLGFCSVGWQLDHGDRHRQRIADQLPRRRRYGKREEDIDLKFVRYDSEFHSTQTQIRRALSWKGVSPCPGPLCARSSSMLSNISVRQPAPHLFFLLSGVLLPLLLLLSLLLLLLP